MAVFEKAAALERLNRPFALASIISSRGVVPRRSGRMLFTKDGEREGTLGGHRIEEEVAREATICLEEGRGRRVTVAAGHGEVDIMIDPVNTARCAIIIGHGHVGRAVAESLWRVGYEIEVCDIVDVECPFASHIHTGEDWRSALAGVEVTKDCAIVVTTHDKDEVLGKLDVSKAFYVGVLSSRSRAVPGKDIFMPMGLDLGGESPQEIAVAVTAEIMAARVGRLPEPMGLRRGRLVVVRGAGDLATGTIIRLHRAGLDVVALETARPTQVRRNVSLAEAVWDGRTSVDGVEAVRIHEPSEAFRVLDEGAVPILVDPDCGSLQLLRPAILVDAVMAKRNLGTRRDMAGLVIGLGPGFEAGVDVDAVVETKRGHTLGRVIRKGSAIPNTGIPGEIAGHSSDRVVRSSRAGVFRSVRTFGDLVHKGDVLAYVDDEPQTSAIDGIVRGMLHDGLEVTEGFKIADVDPRGESVDWHTPSDKAYAIAGAVLELVEAFFAGR